MKESIIAVVRAIFLLCTCFSTRHSSKPRDSFVHLETALSLPSFPFSHCWLDPALIWAARVGGCQSDTSAAPPPAWSCPQALSARWWGLTSFSQSAHSLLSSPRSSSSPGCRRQCALADPGSPSAPWHPRAAGSAAFAYRPASAEQKRRAVKNPLGSLGCDNSFTVQLSLKFVLATETFLNI